MGAVIVIISGILLFASTASFIPQYNRIICRKTHTGIAPYYLLLNLIVATEQFALGLHFFVDNNETMDDIVHSPPTFGDWLNIAQFSVIWLCHLILFGFYLYYPPATRTTKSVTTAIYISFFLISVVPVIYESTLPPTGASLADPRWIIAIFFITHTFFINHVITVLAVVALFPQRREILSRLAPCALSTTSLAAQAVIFALVALAWTIRLSLPWSISIVSWYRYLLVGWAAVDNLIFAAVQTVLYWTLRGLEVEGNTSNETTPLVR